MFRRILCFVVLGLSWAGVSQATTTYCDGTVVNVLLYGDGTLMIMPTFRNDWLTLCNVQEVRSGIDTVTCLGWYSMAMTAKKEGKSITTSYDSASAPSCSTVPTYTNSPAPIYVMIRDQ